MRKIREALLADFKILPLFLRVENHKKYRKKIWICDFIFSQFHAKQRDHGIKYLTCVI